MRSPPLSIVVVCLLTVVAVPVQAFRELPAASERMRALPIEGIVVASSLIFLLVAFFLVTLAGLWMMRRWAVILRALVHAIVPVQMTMAWDASWVRFPLLGPFVGWFWFAVFLACTLPHWRRMSWRFP